MNKLKSTDKPKKAIEIKTPKLTVDILDKKPFPSKVLLYAYYEKYDGEKIPMKYGEVFVFIKGQSNPDEIYNPIGEVLEQPIKLDHHGETSFYPNSDAITVKVYDEQTLMIIKDITIK